MALPEKRGKIMSGKNKSALARIGRIEERILAIRGQRVIVDADLAELYGASTKSLNQAVRRNRDRSPDDFVFQLTDKEKADVVTNCDHLKKLRFSSTLPYAFTEHGAIMAASVLNKPWRWKSAFTSCARLCGCARCWSQTQSWRASWSAWNTSSNCTTAN